MTTTPKGVTMKYRQTAGEQYFGKQETMNPLPGAAMLLRQSFGRVGIRKIKRGLFGRRRTHRGNPLPAVGGILAAAGGGLKLGRRVDPAKHAVRLGVVQQQAKLARQGDETALANLLAIGQGIQWPGQWADVAAAAAQQYENIEATFEKKGAKAGAAAAARAAREARFLEAGTSIAGSAAQALLSRGRARRPKRRRRTSSYGGY